ncbi:MAG TPA: GNAT family N-acetyltransferase [Candidatus Limnocylindria bacterium]|jgi:GNAT superfamily N-acetyltransferase|nr:GNAT family N-acetyltransferase [Candidatus Limnocylindria bacterium]
MATGAGKLTIRPLTAARVDDVKTVTRGTWGATCWDLFPRFTAAQQRELGTSLGGPGTAEKKRREVLAKLARRRKNSAGLVAYEDREPIGFLSLGPRTDFSRIANSKATPPVDDVEAWVVPCITVRRGHRGKGVAVAMLRAALEYAGKRGAPAVEGYPRADGKRVHDDFAFIGTEAMFRKAGFRKIRGVLPALPKGWAPRVTMRAKCGSSPRTSSASPRRSKPAR